MRDLDEAIEKFGPREIDTFRYWMGDPAKLAARLLFLSDFLDEFGIGIGDHSDRPMLLAAATLLEKEKK